MNLCRFLHDGRESYGFYLNDEQVLPLSAVADRLKIDLPAVSSLLDLVPGGDLFSQRQQWEASLPSEVQQELAISVNDVKLLTPLAASGKFLLLAGNYAEHVREGGGQVEERDRTFPYLFMKPPTTWTHPGDPVRIPAFSPNQIDWELELGVVIGRRCSGVTAADALKCVAGYTIVNDVSDRGFHHAGEKTPRPKDAFFNWQHGKWHDTFCPWGPCLQPADHCANPQQLRLVLEVNGQVEQDGRTDAMIFSVAEIIEFVSRFVTLLPGDVISTGTPAGVGKAKGRFLRSGDVMQGRIEGIGTLTSPVI